MELSVIDKKLAMDSRDIAKQKLFNLLAETSDEDFAKEFVELCDKVFAPKDTSGFVYIIHDDIALNTKIGRTKDIKKRLRALRCGNPNLKLYGYMKCNNCCKVETLLHRHFEMKWIHGEIFNINPKTAFEELCKLQDEYGYHEVNPVCIEASNIVYSAKSKIRTI